MIPRENITDPMSEPKRLRALVGGNGQRSSHEPSDEQIVAGLVAGEEWAAEALYDRLHPVVDRALRRVLQSNADHDDQVQVVFERVIRTLVERKFAGACSLSTWATAIASNVASPPGFVSRRTPQAVAGPAGSVTSSACERPGTRLGTRLA